LFHFLLQQALAQHDLADDTIIVLLGDHGWSLDEHAEWSKFGLYGEATRVPLLIYDPSLSR
jgi:iduronate 2-sulfatase